MEEKSIRKLDLQILLVVTFPYFAAIIILLFWFKSNKLRPNQQEQWETSISFIQSV